MEMETFLFDVDRVNPVYHAKTLYTRQTLRFVYYTYYNMYTCIHNLTTHTNSSANNQYEK